MRLYHSLASMDAFRAVAGLPSGFCYLVSAYYLFRYAQMRVYCQKILRESSQVMLDSGMVSALYAGDSSWSARSEYIVSLARNLPFHSVVALDLPTNRHLLAGTGMTATEAKKITLQNARMFYRVYIPQKKIFVLQGKTEKDYEYMALEYERMGLFAESERKVGFAVGSLPGRRWREVTDIVRLCREMVPRRFSLHAFGIASDRRVVELSALGVDSVDSSTASRAAAYGCAICPRSGRRLPLSPVNAGGRSALIAWNINALEALKSFSAEN
jgi:hypothetical protein